jgi:hypothetical protein
MKPGTTPLFFCLALLTAILAGSSPVRADSLSSFEVEIEVGPVWQSRNEAQIPNDASGTRFSIVDVVGKGPYPAARAYITWNLNERHGIRALLAPLSIRGDGVLDSPVDFAGASFDAGVPTEAVYKFNSWRLTYRYQFRRSGRLLLWIGFTAKIRDAKIELGQEGISARKTDLGFVPLLHFRAEYQLRERWNIALDLDALAGGPGRAEDVSLKFHYRINERLDLAAGYRTVEGGADVDEVYTFAWLHYATASVRLYF